LIVLPWLKRDLNIPLEFSSDILKYNLITHKAKQLY